MTEYTAKGHVLFKDGAPFIELPAAPSELIVIGGKHIVSYDPYPELKGRALAASNMSCFDAHGVLLWTAPPARQYRGDQYNFYCGLRVVNYDGVPTLATLAWDDHDFFLIDIETGKFKQHTGGELPFNRPVVVESFSFQPVYPNEPALAESNETFHVPNVG